MVLVPGAKDDLLLRRDEPVGLVANDVGPRVERDRAAVESGRQRYAVDGHPHVRQVATRAVVRADHDRRRLLVGAREPVRAILPNHGRAGVASASRERVPSEAVLLRVSEILTRFRGLDARVLFVGVGCARRPAREKKGDGAHDGDARYSRHDAL